MCVCVCHCVCACCVWVCVREREREHTYVCVKVCILCVWAVCMCTHTHTPGPTDFNDFYLALMTLVALTWPQWLSLSFYRKCSVSAKCVVKEEGGSFGNRTTGKITNSSDPIHNSPVAVKCHHNWHKAACHKTAGPARRGHHQRRRIMGRMAAQMLLMHKLQTQRKSNWRVGYVWVCCMFFPWPFCLICVIFMTHQLDCPFV